MSKIRSDYNSQLIGGVVSHVSMSCSKYVLHVDRHSIQGENFIYLSLWAIFLIGLVSLWYKGEFGI